jgi:BirA family transcriptional regulator, biotin operon repressor / biotin---[acetyl-CoA-carboxylase] ligase
MTAAVHRVALTGSTNADAMALARAGRELPLWVIADSQTSGKGRSGRTWVSLPGNFHASYAVHLTCDLAKAGQISLVAGVAVIDALNAACATASPPDFRLKWPNDIMVGAAKCGGILIESTPDRVNGGLHGVIGFGLNLVCHPTELDRPLTNLARLGCRLNPSAVLGHLDRELAKAIAVWNGGRGFEQLRAQWLAVGTPIGTAMSVLAGSRHAAGRFAGLNTDGALLLADASGQTTTMTFGDVTLGDSALSPRS